MPSTVESHGNAQNGQILKLLARLQFQPLTEEEEGQNRAAQQHNHEEESRVAKAKKDGDKGATPNLRPLIAPHVAWLDTTKLSAAIAPLADIVLPCLEERPGFESIGRLFFWAYAKYPGAEQKTMRDRFLDLGVQQAGDFGAWLSELRQAADNLVAQDAACGPIVAELLARLHPLSCGKLAK